MAGELTDVERRAPRWVRDGTTARPVARRRWSRRWPRRVWRSRPEHPAEPGRARCCPRSPSRGQGRAVLEGAGRSRGATGASPRRGRSGSPGAGSSPRRRTASGPPPVRSPGARCRPSGVGWHTGGGRVGGRTDARPVDAPGGGRAERPHTAAGRRPGRRRVGRSRAGRARSLRGRGPVPDGAVGPPGHGGASAAFRSWRSTTDAGRPG